MLKLIKVEDNHDPNQEQNQAKINVDTIASQHKGAVRVLNWNEQY
jgi:hypothetical protein